MTVGALGVGAIGAPRASERRAGNTKPVVGAAVGVAIGTAVGVIAARRGVPLANALGLGVLAGGPIAAASLLNLGSVPSSSGKSVAIGAALSATIGGTIAATNAYRYGIRDWPYATTSRLALTIEAGAGNAMTCAVVGGLLASIAHGLTKPS